MMEFSDPKELQSKTSILTMVLFILYALTVRLGWPQIVGYIVVFFIVSNLVLIGKLFYVVEQNKQEINVAKNRFSAIFRMVINLVLLFLLLFHLELF